MKFHQPERVIDHLRNALAAIGRIEEYLQGQDVQSFYGSDSRATGCHQAIILRLLA